DAERGPNPLLGNALILGTVICEAAFSVLGKLATARLRALTIATLVSCLGALSFLPFALWTARGFDFGAVGGNAWLALCYYAVGATVLPYLLWYHGLPLVPAGVAGIFTGIIPVSAVILAAVVLSEPLRAAHLVGIACVLGALGLTVRGERRRTERLPPLRECGGEGVRLGAAGGEHLEVELGERELGRDIMGVERGLARH
ncbi:MAG: DMT family transporter, partial [Chloroflexia bacterium]|nr:DMT family transporter [Chloroflexia bacterium]